MPKGQPRLGVWNKRHKRYDFTYKSKAYRVARLICEAFHGPCPEGLVCIHKDENSKNNHKDNLKWGTQKENLNCPKFVAYCSQKFKEVRKKHGAKNNRHIDNGCGVVV